MSDIDQNRQLAIDFLNHQINEKSPEAAAALTHGERYIQHNPMAADGAAAMVELVKSFHSEHPEMSIEIKRTIAEGDYVVVHHHVTFSPDDRGMAVIDIFRFEDGKVREHWDVLQEVPETAANNNTMF